MLAVVQIVTLRFEGGNDFEIYTHPRTIGHSHRLGDKRSTVVYGIHMAFTPQLVFGKDFRKVFSTCFPRVAMCKDSHQGIDDQNPLTTLKKSNPLSPESFLAVLYFDLERPRNFERQL